MGILDTFDVLDCLVHRHFCHRGRTVPARTVFLGACGCFLQDETFGDWNVLGCPT